MSGKAKVGIALDSGGAMGGAHIGVLEVLQEQGIPLDIIVGSSAGAAVGAFYASGTLGAFRELISGLSFIEALGFYADPVFPVSGLFSGKRARRFLHSLLGDVRIEDLPVTFVAVATDLLTGETVPISSGNLVDAVMASISMPGIFKPVVLGDRLLTDGGVSDPLPLDILTEFSPDITIACNLHSRLPNKLSVRQKRAIVKAQEKSGQEEEDLSSWIVNQMLSLVRTDRLSSRLKAVGEALLATGAQATSAIRDNALFTALQEQLGQGRDRISSLLERSFARRDKTDMLNIFEVMLCATNIQQYQKNRLMLMNIRPDILIEPVLDGVRALELNKGELTIEEGRIKALQKIPDLLRLLEEKGVERKGNPGSNACPGCRGFQEACPE